MIEVSKKLDRAKELTDTLSLHDFITYTENVGDAEKYT